MSSEGSEMAKRGSIKPKALKELRRAERRATKAKKKVARSQKPT